MPSQASLNVSLTPELTSYVAALVASGRYRSASEVLRAALRLLQRDEPAETTLSFGAASGNRSKSGTSRS